MSFLKVLLLEKNPETLECLGEAFKKEGIKRKNWAAFSFFKAELPCLFMCFLKKQSLKKKTGGHKKKGRQKIKKRL